MNEFRGNIWDFGCHWIVIPTNGIVNKEKRAVMGAGMAKQAARMYPGIDLALGRAILDNGNIVQPIAAIQPYGRDLIGIVSFPVKHHWNEQADLDLIRSSTEALRQMADKDADKMMGRRIAMPRVGCGNGGRDWITEVKPILHEIIGGDGRFWIVDHMTGSEK